jgi:hypothetical protein
MKETWNFTHCVSTLTNEIGLLREISALQDKVWQAVMNREWTGFDEMIRELNRLGGEFTVLEDERARLFLALTNGSRAYQSIEEKPFYASILNLPAEERLELSDLYRKLKMESFRMRALNETFLAYLSEAKTLAAAYIEAVCPARGGKLYTRKGRRVSQDLRSIAFNNHF